MLEGALGREAGCPGNRCAFWVEDADVAVCLLEGAERSLSRNLTLARRVRELRGELERAGGRPVGYAADTPAAAA